MNEALLLHLLSDVQPRRIRVIENLLVGKRTVSTLYWALRYDILPWLGFEKQLNRHDVAYTLEKLMVSGFVTMSNLNLVAKLTLSGANQKRQLFVNWYKPVVLKDWLNVSRTAAWQGFQLAVQVVSEFQAKNQQYYPLQVSFEERKAVKQWFLAHRNSTLSSHVRTELDLFLAGISQPFADIWANLLVGHKISGKTLEQLTESTHRSKLELAVIKADVTTKLVMSACQFPDRFNVLHDLLKTWKVSPISTSAIQTLTNFKAGTAISSIVKQRELKTSTVHEHLLEAAIFLPIDDFPYENLLPIELQYTFNQHLMGIIDDWTFDSVASMSVDFWQFRLYEIMRSKLSDDYY